MVWPLNFKSESERERERGGGGKNKQKIPKNSKLRRSHLQFLAVCILEAVQFFPLMVRDVLLGDMGWF